MIYLDNGATSWPKPETVYQAVNQAMRQSGNAGRGVNASSLWASQVLYEARTALASFFNIKKPEQIIFTQNVTEALNIALKGFLASGDHVLISSLEHNAVVRPLEALKNDGITYTIVPCDEEGNIDLEALEESIRASTKLICLNHASNVLGTIQSAKEVGMLAKKSGLSFLLDAAQTAGVIPIDVEEMKIDFLAFTGHKSLFGPQGSGGLYIRDGLEVTPLIHGGTGSHSASLIQPRNLPEGLESGTRNIPAIAGLTAGVQYCQENIRTIRNHELYLVEKVIDFFSNSSRIKVYGPKNSEDRVGLVSFNISDFSADTVGCWLDHQYQIVTRTGLHCSPLAHRVAGTSEMGSIRISISPFTSDQEVDTLLKALTKLMGG
jgi:cysteine desulfurase family protein